MKKKINPKMFANRLIKWQKEIEERVVEVMTQQGMVTLFNKSIQCEKAKRLMKSKLGSNAEIIVQENTLYDNKGEMAIERIVLTDDNELTCFAPHQSSNYYADVTTDLTKEDSQAVITYIIQNLTKKVA